MVFYEIILKFYSIYNDWESNWNMWFWIPLKIMILNVIGKYNFKCDYKIWFWMSLKFNTLNTIEIYGFEWN